MRKHLMHMGVSIKHDIPNRLPLLKGLCMPGKKLIVSQIPGI